MTYVATLQRKLEDAGYVFICRGVWVCQDGAGTTVAEARMLADCIWKAAKALGEEP